MEDRRNARSSGWKYTLPGSWGVCRRWRRFRPYASQRVRPVSPAPGTRAGAERTSRPWLRCRLRHLRDGCMPIHRTHRTAPAPRPRSLEVQ